MKIIYTPKVGTSDIEVKLCAIHCNKNKVEVGDIICELETSKATYDVESEYEGFVYFIHELNKNILVGKPLAIISTIELSDDELKSETAKINDGSNNNDQKNITKKAQILIDKYQINVSDIDKPIITEKDVQSLYDKIQSNSETSNLNFKENDIVIVGIGGHASMCIDILLQNSNYNIVGFLDDNVTQDLNYGLDYLGSLKNIEKLSSRGLCNAVLGIGFVGNLKKREKIFNYLVKYVKVPTIVHSKSIIEPSANIGQGCQIMAGAIIGSNVLIGNNCILNSGSIVSHDSIILEGTHLTPGAILAGHVKIGKRVTIGMAATIYIGLTISDDIIVNNGKSVIENI